MILFMIEEDCKTIKIMNDGRNTETFYLSLMLNFSRTASLLELLWSGSKLINRIKFKLFLVWFHYVCLTKHLSYCILFVVWTLTSERWFFSVTFCLMFTSHLSPQAIFDRILTYSNIILWHPNPLVLKIFVVGIFSHTFTASRETPPLFVIRYSTQNTRQLPNKLILRWNPGEMSFISVLRCSFVFVWTLRIWTSQQRGKIGNLYDTTQRYVDTDKSDKKTTSGNGKHKSVKMQTKISFQSKQTV